MHIAYVAHTARCALLLDEAGVCVWFLVKVPDDDALPGLRRCVGAQFVASLDPEARGLLARAPEIGKRVLLARTDDGRISLIRFGPLVHFERLETREPAHRLEPLAPAAAAAAAAACAASQVVPPSPGSDPTLELRPTTGDLDDLDDDLVTNVDLDAQRPLVAPYRFPELGTKPPLDGPFAREDRRMVARGVLARALATPASEHPPLRRRLPGRRP